MESPVTATPAYEPKSRVAESLVNALEMALVCGDDWRRGAPQRMSRRESAVSILNHRDTRDPRDVAWAEELLRKSDEADLAFWNALRDALALVVKP